MMHTNGQMNVKTDVSDHPSLCKVKDMALKLKHVYDIKRENLRA